jgi:hypothetical protein
MCGRGDKFKLGTKFPMSFLLDALRARALYGEVELTLARYCATATNYYNDNVVQCSSYNYSDKSERINKNNNAKCPTGIHKTRYRNKDM